MLSILLFLIINSCYLFAVTVIEILPKEKKQKEEKTQILGQVAVDLLAIAQGQYNSI